MGAGTASDFLIIQKTQIYTYMYIDEREKYIYIYIYILRSFRNVVGSDCVRRLNVTFEALK